MRIRFPRVWLGQVTNACKSHTKTIDTRALVVNKKKKKKKSAANKHAHMCYEFIKLSVSNGGNVSAEESIDEKNEQNTYIYIYNFNLYDIFLY